MTKQLTTTPKKQLTIKQLLAGDYFKNELAKLLPKHIKSERFARVALTAMTRTPNLNKCTQDSLFQCMLDCSSYGLEPDNRLAYLIPYGTKCTLILSYMGLIELCKRNGDVSQVYSVIVKQADFFEYEMGLRRDVTHKPALSNRGEVIGAYAIVKLKDGDFDFEYMETADIEKVKNTSASGNSGPWKDHWEEMAKKTVIRRLLKRQTLSPEVRDAIGTDDVHETKSEQQKFAEAHPVKQVEVPNDEPMFPEEPKAIETPKPKVDIDESMFTSEEEMEKTRAEVIKEEQADDFFKGGEE